MSVDPKVPEKGLATLSSRRAGEGNRQTRLWGDKRGSHTEDCSSGWFRGWATGGLRALDLTLHCGGSAAGPIDSLGLSFSILRVRGSSKESHSLEGTRVAKVRFMVGAGALVCPFPRTQLTQFGEGCPICTGNTAAREEVGRCCSTKRHMAHEPPWPEAITAPSPSSRVNRVTRTKPAYQSELGLMCVHFSRSRVSKNKPINPFSHPLFKKQASACYQEKPVSSCCQLPSLPWHTETAQKEVSLASHAWEMGHLPGQVQAKLTASRWLPEEAPAKWETHQPQRGKHPGSGQ